MDLDVDIWGTFLQISYKLGIMFKNKNKEWRDVCDTIVIIHYDQ